MKEQSRVEFESIDLKKNGRCGSFDPLEEIPINKTKWYEHIRKIVEDEINLENYEENDIIAKTTISRVSYTDIETGECDVRWEARYEIVV